MQSRSDTFIQSAGLWAKYNITLIFHIVANGSLRFFASLSADYNIPLSHLFRYLQLSHAFSSQFSTTPLRLKQSDLEHVICTGCLEKPASVLYNHLPLATLPDLCNLHQMWSRDMPELDNEDWEDIWDVPFCHLVSQRDRFIQFKLVHRAYFTPHRLHK